MKFCQDHWDQLRAAIRDRGLGDLIAQDGHHAAQRAAREIEGGVTLSNFDPLMAAHWAIVGNANRTIERASGGGTVLYLMGEGPEDDVELPGGEGRTWPRCPLCYLGLAHELTCRDERCTLPKVDGYAWMIDRAADDALETWERLKTEETNPQ